MRGDCSLGGQCSDSFRHVGLISSADSGDGQGKASTLALPETMDEDQKEQLRQQKEMQRLEARIREAASRQAMPGGPKVEGEAERRMRELYEERLREYGDLAAVDDERGDERYDTKLNRMCHGF